MKADPRVLSIAGFDPSAGAGILADAATANALGTYLMAVCTVITHQNDAEFRGAQALAKQQVLDQLYPLVDRYSFGAIKIGAITEIPLLSTLLEFCQEHFPETPVVWDPVIRSSSGFTFLPNSQLRLLNQEMLHGLHVITPNLTEIVCLSEALGVAQETPQQFAQDLSAWTPVLLKDGHGEGETVTDVLWQAGSATAFSRPRSVGRTKHGSGCVLSTAIAVYLARGFSLPEACHHAGSYTSRFIGQSSSPLGLHSSEFV